ncbi:MFS family permease [Aeromicrobium panaciterrae]|uniref:MFS family permease n=1 Tax=Aeromicrobium panaciterrae TaxID=363861 RepID=A0ABU1UPF5_9ACTN|nr:MFS transporter [Aeromicrobium panaciterrae]MDR7087057.1 MFS family permease [Aeromicrobium panaciterrae]
MLGTYRDVLSRPGAALFSFTGMISRFPLSMVGLGLVLVVSDRTGSYGHAGSVAAAYVLASAALGPTQGRLTDKLGQAPVLLVVGALYAVGISLTLVAIDRDWETPWVHVCAALAGAVMPQTGSMVRARWTHVVTDRTQLNTAFSIEAILDEVVFLVGPVVVTFLTIQVSDFSGLVVAAVAAAIGSWALAAQRATAPAASEHTSTTRAHLSWFLLGRVVFASVGLGVLFGSAEVIVVAFATEEGQRGASGVVLAIWAAGSLIAGLLVGALPRSRDPLKRWRTSLLALSLLFVPLLFVSGLVWLAVGMFLTGFMISPTLIASASLVELYVAPSRLTEALTWGTTGLMVGVAPGAAIAGWVVDNHDASAAFMVPLVAGLAGSIVAFTLRPQAEPAAA